MAKRYMITSALPYANGALHLGHLAGAYLPADIYVRYLRLLGKDVLWVCGSDEHGAAITIRAKKEGIQPQQIIDKYHAIIKKSLQDFGMSLDIYHRTSEKLHYQTSGDIFKNILEKGDDIEVQASKQYFDEKYNQFLADRYITGTCPKCQNPEAYGDQCEVCGSDLSPTELINPVSTLSGEKPILKETSHWFFKLQNHEKWLREWIEKGTIDGVFHHDPKSWKNHVRGQCLSWLDGGLHARSITRDLDWGIPVPLPEAEGKVLYVWFDAPIGYISATKQYCQEKGLDWKTYWQDEDTQLIHFIGKDNIVFHCIVFPAVLKAHGDFNLPINVPANQFLNFEDKKFSTSKGWGINLDEYLDEFKDFEGAVDALRYVLTRIMPENKDANFKWAEFIELFDNELVNNLGNFVNRVMVLTHKYFDGEVPSLLERGAPYDTLKNLVNQFQQQIEQYQFKFALQTVMEISSFGNTYLQEKAPWVLAKENLEDPEIAKSLSFSAEIVQLLSVLMHPFTPETSDKMRTMLQLPAISNGTLNLLLNVMEQGDSLFLPKHVLGQAALLFQKINDRKDTSRKEIVDRQLAKLQAVEAVEAEVQRATVSAPVKSTISYDDFAKMDLRTGTIVHAEKVPKADKLLKLEVDLGFERRTVVSGIAKHYDPTVLPGQRVLVLVNLAPRKLRGIESNGMILMAEDADGKLIFVSTTEGSNGQSVS